MAFIIPRRGGGHQLVRAALAMIFWYPVGGLTVEDVAEGEALSGV